MEARATVGDSRVRHLSGLVVMEARATVGDSKVRTSCGSVGPNHLVDSSSDRSVEFELLSRQVKVQAVTDPNRPTSLNSRRPLSPGPGAHPSSLPFMDSRRPLSPGPGAHPSSLPFIDSRRPLSPGPGAHPSSLPFMDSRAPPKAARARLRRYLVPTLTNLRATVGDSRVRHLSGLLVMEARAGLSKAPEFELHVDQ